MRQMLLAGLIAAGMTAGCGPQSSDQPPDPLNAVTVQAIANPQIDQAVIAQHTLYPYHFIAGSDKLNELGHRDLYVLAEHFKCAPGSLNVDQGDASADLYSARLKAVTQALKDSGVGTSRVQLTSGLSGGDGLAGPRVIKILERAYEPPQQQPQQQQTPTNSDSMAQTEKGY